MAINNFIRAKLHGILRNVYFLYFIIFRRLYPIDEDKFLFVSMSGKSYGCNVKPLSDYAIGFRNKKAVWAFTKKMYCSVHDDKISKVLLNTFVYYKELYTSKYVVSNFRMTRDVYPYKRNGQKYMQLWHGTALKKIEADAPSLGTSYMKSVIPDSEKIDYFISGSDFMTRIYKSAFWYNGEVYETGMPRNDIFFMSLPGLVDKVKNFLHINSNENIVLYAPTFRNDKDSFECYDISTELLMTSIRKKFGGKWKLLVRLHPALVKEHNLERIEKMFPNAIDASAYPDIQELLYAADILITDYSSSMFDYMYSNKPCFLYVKDKDTYDRGFYINIDDLPFPKIISNEYLESVIASFSIDDYRCKIRMFEERIGSVDDGNATERCYNLLIKG